jgi:hypothetical protein
MEINDDEITKGIRHASTHRYDGFPDPFANGNQYNDANRKIKEKELERSRSLFGRRAPKASKIGTLLR